MVVVKVPQSPTRQSVCDCSGSPRSSPHFFGYISSVLRSKSITLTTTFRIDTERNCKCDWRPSFDEDQGHNNNNDYIVKSLNAIHHHRTTKLVRTEQVHRDWVGGKPKHLSTPALMAVAKIRVNNPLSLWPINKRVLWPTARSASAF